MNATFIKIYKTLVVGVLLLIALGGSVRAMNAGLACPDWPLCFGDIIPDYHPQVYFEFIHRVFAGLIAIVTFILNIILIRNPKVPKSIKVISWGTFLLLIVQVVMGGLTVLMQLQNKIVTTHLALGTALFASLLWIYFWLTEDRIEKEAVLPSWALGLSVFVGSVVFGQILLGGLVASNYAALVCTDFPLCHGEFIPTLKGIIGLQVMHRLGAYFTTITIVGFSIVAHRKLNHGLVKKWSVIMLALVLVQVAVGIANVVLLTPPVITVLHLATGVTLFGASLRIVYVTKGARQLSV